MLDNDKLRNTMLDFAANETSQSKLSGILFLIDGLTIFEMIENNELSAAAKEKFAVAAYESLYDTSSRYYQCNRMQQADYIEILFLLSVHNDSIHRMAARTLEEFARTNDRHYIVSSTCAAYFTYKDRVLAEITDGYVEEAVEDIDLDLYLRYITTFRRMLSQLMSKYSVDTAYSSYEKLKGDVEICRKVVDKASAPANEKAANTYVSASKPKPADYDAKYARMSLLGIMKCAKAGERIGHAGFHKALEESKDDVQRIDSFEKLLMATESIQHHEDAKAVKSIYASANKRAVFAGTLGETIEQLKKYNPCTQPVKTSPLYRAVHLLLAGLMIAAMVFILTSARTAFLFSEDAENVVRIGVIIITALLGLLLSGFSGLLSGGIGAAVFMVALPYFVEISLVIKAVIVLGFVIAAIMLLYKAFSGSKKAREKHETATNYFKENYAAYCDYAQYILTKAEKLRDELRKNGRDAKYVDKDLGFAEIVAYYQRAGEELGRLK